nr:hypothetical protein [uncultured Draconibacterium sp.]
MVPVSVTEVGAVFNADTLKEVATTSLSIITSVSVVLAQSVVLLELEITETEEVYILLFRAVLGTS